MSIDRSNFFLNLLMVINVPERNCISEHTVKGHVQRAL